MDYGTQPDFIQIDEHPSIVSCKASMEVKIISSETIKPSSPTPHHLRTHRLSLLDQIEVLESVYIPVLLFYSSASQERSLQKKSDILKESLSKTLTHFYPFAGRLKDWFSIDCNDEGVLYTEAQIATDMSTVLQSPRTDLLPQLSPLHSLQSLPESLNPDHVLVAIQVNFFACGGMAICVCVDHVVADGAAIGTFIKSWSSTASIDNYVDFDVIYDCNSLFPSWDLSDLVNQFADEDKDNQESQPRGEIVTKRLLFNGSEISDLRDKIGQVSNSIPHRPSRFEALSALIWAAMLSTTSENDETFSKVTICMNLRDRTNPPLPKQCIGNVYHVKEVESLTEKTMNLGILAGKIHETITKVDDEYVKILGKGGVDYLKFLGNKQKNKTFLLVSWCRFPFYEADFGWGKPIWCCNALRSNRVVTFMDANDGEGIEAWITLGQDEMLKFEQHPGIVNFRHIVS